MTEEAYIEEMLSTVHGGLQSLEEVLDTVARGWLPMSALSDIIHEMRGRLARCREEFGCNADDAFL